MTPADEEFLTAVVEYYSTALARHGAMPRGVDWNGPEGQTLRFRQLLRVIDRPGRFSLNDLGCGYGALLDHLHTSGTDVDYAGCDVAPAMIAAARARHADHPEAQFHVGTSPRATADYSVASGVFNVRLQQDPARWQAYVERTLDVLHGTSRIGFAFNCLTVYSDDSHKREDLFYADPSRLFDRCQRLYSRHVAVLHDYGLYEFTILVRKSL